MNIETQKRFLIRIGFWAVVILLLIVGLKYVLPIVLPFVAAFLIAAALNRPIVFLAGKLGGRRVLPAVGLTLVFYILAAALFSFLGVRVLKFIWDTVRALPQIYMNTLEPALETAFAYRFYSLELRDQTRVGEDIWKRAGEDSLRGLFLQELRRRYDEAADAAEREQIVQAVRFGLAAMDGRDI